MVSRDTPRAPHRQGRVGCGVALAAEAEAEYRCRRFAVLSLLSQMASSSGFCWVPEQAARSDAGIVGIATVSGEMCAAALDAEHSALFARLAIGDFVRCPILEIRKPKH